MSATIEDASATVRPRKPTSSICPILSRRLGSGLGERLGMGCAEGDGDGDREPTTDGATLVWTGRQAAMMAATAPQPARPRKRRRVSRATRPILAATGPAVPDGLRTRGDA